MTEQNKPFYEKFVKKNEAKIHHQKKKEIDEKISSNCRNWTVNRMPKTDLAVLRLAVCEILFLDDMPNSVSINEAVELAKKYGEETSFSYINGILGAISRSEDN